MYTIGNLTGKKAIITGGASGLGLATAKLFIENGAEVLIADYSDSVEDVAASIGAQAYKVNVSNDTDVKAMVEKAVELFGEINIAVACAGIGGANYAIDQETIENWQKVLDVDLTGVMLTDRYVIEQMRKQGKGGSVINLASMFGLCAVPDNVVYSASKGGVVNLTRAAGTKYAAENIRVNAVCPGVIKTPLIDEESRRIYAPLHPAQRLGEPDEVAKLITFLASDDAQFITGAAISIDGGYTAV
ncbi:MAG: SDR family oxidoreductase [Actinomycetaceae bacterium]|nr:SDR family oxidoreductase [Actinomycetaceae bacterium]